MLRTLYKAGVVSLFVIITVVCLSCCRNQVDERGYVLPQDNIKCLYYNERDFKRSVTLADSAKSYDRDIKGGIVPHHLLAHEMIASFFKAVSIKKYDYIIVVAPNHDRIGSLKINTAKGNWETPFGVLNAGEDIIGSLVDEGTAGNSRSLMEKEHSISSLVPYIKYYQPDCKIVPLLLHGNLGMENSIEFGRLISKKMKDKNYLAVASVDFSHYLSVEKADKMDEITLKAIEERDLKAISRMNNDNLDSPPGIITLLTIMNENSIKNMFLLEHNNSAKIARQNSSSTTGYFTMFFYK
jgi:AmmeMemoRadiSam system protein B